MIFIPLSQYLTRHRACKVLYSYKLKNEIVFKNPFLVTSLTAAVLGEVTGAFTGDMPRVLVGETENGLAVMLPLFNGDVAGDWPYFLTGLTWGLVFIGLVSRTMLDLRGLCLVESIFLGDGILLFSPDER